MPPKKQLSLAFPHRYVVCASVALCLCGLASIVLAVLGFIHRILGYYWATGFWCGVVVLVTGVSGLVCTQVRDVCSTKTFMIASICGGIASLAMSALSAGGVDASSGFYDTSQPMSDSTESISYSVHGACLALGILQLVLCIVSDGICFYYIFVEKGSTMFRVKDNKRHKKRKKHKRGHTNRHASDSCRAPLCDDITQSKRPKLETKVKTVNESKSVGKHRSCRRSASPSRRQTEPERDISPTRISFVRRASFSTFGHGISPERESLIVHPGDDMSVADTFRCRTPDVRTTTENPYAQTALFQLPVPIDDDDDLPPYELVDSNPYENAGTEISDNQQLKRNRRNADKVTTSIESGKRSDERVSRRNRHRANRKNIGSTMTTNARGRREDVSVKVGSADELEKETDGENTRCYPSLRHSRSAGLLDAETESVRVLHDGDVLESAHSQGVLFRDFARSRDIIENPERSVRSQSLRINREKRMERRKRALSAEIKPNMDKIISNNHFDQSRAGRDSNSGLFADSRIKPTKFSLRRPVRQIGMPVVRSPVPVRSITSLPLFTPPAKPPRIHSYTVDDFRLDVSEIELDAIHGEDCPFMDEVNNSDKADAINTPNDVADSSKSNTECMEYRTPGNENVNSETVVPETAPVSPCMAIKPGPVIELKVTKGANSLTPMTPVEKECNANKHTGTPTETITSCILANMEVHETSDTKEITAKSSEKDTLNFMELPISPTLKEGEQYPKPQVRKSKLSFRSTMVADDCDQAVECNKKEESAERFNNNNVQVPIYTAVPFKNALTTTNIHALAVGLPPLASISKVSISPLNDRHRQRASHANTAELLNKDMDKYKGNIINDSTVATEGTVSSFVSDSQGTEYNGARPKTSFRKPVPSIPSKNTSSSIETSRSDVLTASSDTSRAVDTQSSVVSYNLTPLTSELTFESRRQLSISPNVHTSHAKDLQLENRAVNNSSESSAVIADIKSVTKMKDNLSTTLRNGVSVSESKQQTVTVPQIAHNKGNGLVFQSNENDRKVTRSTVLLTQTPSLSGKPIPPSVSNKTITPAKQVPVPSVRTSSVHSRHVVNIRPTTTVPALAIPCAAQRTYPQGVLHLPQSQHSRHVKDTRQPGLDSNIQPQRVQQNYVLPSVNQEPNKPLFSVLL